MKREQDELSNRTVVVTGAARGVGRATAEAFSQAGATVFGIDITDQGKVAWETITVDLGEADATAKVIKSVPQTAVSYTHLTLPTSDLV